MTPPHRIALLFLVFAAIRCAGASQQAAAPQAAPPDAATSAAALPRPDAGAPLTSHAAQVDAARLDPPDAAPVRDAPLPTNVPRPDAPLAADATVAPDATSTWFRPRPGTTWQWQLTGLPLDQTIDVQMYDVDLFTTTAAEIMQLHSKSRVVICYFSAGSWEKFRPDSDKFPATILGAPLDPPFQDERWLDIRSATTRMLILTRLDLARSKGCDGVEPDNVDGADNKNGLGLTAADQLNFNRFIAAEAHKRGLSVGLKNDLSQLDALVADFDWALNEECVKFNECASYAKNFIASGKAVFHAEYAAAAQRDRICAVTAPLKLSTIIKKIDLDASRVSCP